MSIGKKKLLILIPVVILVIIAILFGVYRFRLHQQELAYQQLQENTHVEDATTVADEPEEEYRSPIDFDAAKETNSDIVAWIQVPDTKIDYPILQSAEDMEEDYYLEHNLDGSEGYPGCIYIQKFQQADFNDPVTIVYGHDMKDGSMFQNLHEFEDVDFFTEHRFFTVYTPTETKNYHIIAATQYNDRLIPATYHYFMNELDVMEFVQSLAQEGEDENSHVIDPGPFDSSAQYVVLSTCTTDSSQRWIVVGVLQ